MKIVKCRPQNHIEEIMEIKRTALKDADAYDEDDKESSYSNYKYFLIGKIDGEGVATAAFREPEGDVVKNLYTDNSTAELKNIHIRPEYQRKGIGSKLVSLVEEKARENEYSRMVLRTTDLQERAHMYYESNGYDRIKTVNPEYKEINYDLVFFEKSLNN